MTYREERPWGSFETICSGPNYKVKTLSVKPYERLSLQKHEHREEHWVVVAGTGTITVGDRQLIAFPGTTAHIPKGEIHRLEAGESELILIEVQRGSQLYEDDITRLSDDYGRK
jgi:mannose-6-phosphate isomerase-like protein (cupin superfamily)